MKNNEYGRWSESQRHKFSMINVKHTANMSVLNKKLKRLNENFSKENNGNILKQSNFQQNWNILLEIIPAKGVQIEKWEVFLSSGKKA